MRSAPLAALLALTAAAPAFAASPTAPGMAPPITDTAPVKPNVQTTPATPATPETPAAPTDSATTAPTAPAIPAALAVGEPVKDNTGATIGSIAQLQAGAGGQQMAVIKMGADTFQVQADRLGAAGGAATINMTQAQIGAMLHPASRQ